MPDMRGAWRHLLYVRKKETAMCRDHIDGTVVLVLREIMPECVLKLVRGLYPYPPDTPYRGHCYCVSASFAHTMSKHVLTNTCVAIYT